VLEPGVLRQAFTDADVVFEALSPRGDMAGKVEGVFDQVLALAREHGTRLGILGGASSLLVSPDGPRLIDADPVPDEVRPEADLGIHKLEVLKAAGDDLDWLYLSPPAEFGAWVPSTETGEYRTSDDVLLRSPDAARRSRRSTWPWRSSTRSSSPGTPGAASTSPNDPALPWDQLRAAALALGTA